MTVQVILREGEPEYAVLPWAEYQALKRAAGQQEEKLPTAPASEPSTETVMKPSLKALRALREGRQLLAEELARSVGISPAYLAMIETGERHPDRAIRRSLAMAVGVSGWEED